MGDAARRSDVRRDFIGVCVAGLPGLRDAAGESHSTRESGCENNSLGIAEPGMLSQQKAAVLHDDRTHTNRGHIVLQSRYTESG